MALIVCPECGGNVSDRAPSCPHCGCPTDMMSTSVKNTPTISVEKSKKCPRCKTGQIKRSVESDGNYVCDFCGCKWDSLDNLRDCHFPTFEEEQNYVLKYIASKNGPVSKNEISERFNWTLHRSVRVLDALQMKYLLGKDKIGNYFIPDPKTIQPLKNKNDPCARIVDATIQNLGVAINAKDSVMDQAKSLLAENQYEDLQKKFANLSEAFDNYYMSALNHQSALYSQRGAIKAKKIDPAIAGGVAQGIAGVGAGVYTAVNQQQRNQLIDEARAASTARVRSTGGQQSGAQRICENCFYDVMAYINAYQELETIYNAELSKQKEKISTEKEKKSRLSKWLFG